MPGPLRERVRAGGSKAIKAIGKESGEEYYFNSLKQASSILDINGRSISNLLNYPNHTLYSSSLGEYVSVFDGNMKEGSPYVANSSIPRVRTPEPLRERVRAGGVDHSVIPVGGAYARALDKDLNRVATVAVMLLMCVV